MALVPGVGVAHRDAQVVARLRLAVDDGVGDELAVFTVVDGAQRELEVLVAGDEEAGDAAVHLLVDDVQRLHERPDRHVLVDLRPAAESTGFR